MKQNLLHEVSWMVVNSGESVGGWKCFSLINMWRRAVGTGKLQRNVRQREGLPRS
jgi:hypothetical protein